MIDAGDARDLPSREYDRMGKQLIRTPAGVVSANDAAGFLTMLLEWPAADRPDNIGMMLYEPPARGEPHGVALIGQLDADQAEALASSLSALAAELRDRAGR